MTTTKISIPSLGSKESIRTVQVKVIAHGLNRILPTAASLRSQRALTEMLTISIPTLTMEVKGIVHRLNRGLPTASRSSQGARTTMLTTTIPILGSSETAMQVKATAHGLNRILLPVISRSRKSPPGTLEECQNAHQSLSLLALRTTSLAPRAPRRRHRTTLPSFLGNSKLFLGFANPTVSRVNGAFIKDATVISTRIKIQRLVKAVMVDSLLNNNTDSPPTKRSLVSERSTVNHVHDACNREAFVSNTRSRKAARHKRTVVPRLEESTAFERTDNLACGAFSKDDSVFSTSISRNEMYYLRLGVTRGLL